MKEFKNVPIFQYGLNQNNVYIGKGTVELALSSFLQSPVIDKDKPVGVITGITDIRDNYVYGNVDMWKHRYKGFYTYEIHVDKMHKDQDLVIVDEFHLGSVGFHVEEIKDED